MIDYLPTTLVKHFPTAKRRKGTEIMKQGLLSFPPGQALYNEANFLLSSHKSTQYMGLYCEHSGDISIQRKLARECGETVCHLLRFVVVVSFSSNEPRPKIFYAQSNKFDPAELESPQ